MFLLFNIRLQHSSPVIQIKSIQYDGKSSHKLLLYTRISCKIMFKMYNIYVKNMYCVSCSVESLTVQT
jgi:hypothetical protein